MSCEYINKSWKLPDFLQNISSKNPYVYHEEMFWNINLLIPCLVVQSLINMNAHTLVLVYTTQRSSVNFLFLLCTSQICTPNCQDWWLVPLPTKTSCRLFEVKFQWSIKALFNAKCCFPLFKVFVWAWLTTNLGKSSHQRRATQSSAWSSGLMPWVE